MNEISTLGLVVYAIVSLATTTLSGIAGGGAGFIMTPLLIFLGLTPAQAVSTGKFAGLSVTVGSLYGYKAQKVNNKKQVAMVMAIAFVIGLLAPIFIKSLDSEVYRTVIGVLVLLMVPILKFKRLGVDSFEPTKVQKFLGWLALTIALAIQAVFSGGLGVLVVIVLISLLGLDSITAQITKRWSQVLLNVVIVLGIIGSGLVIWKVVAIGLVTSFIGGRFGAVLALKKGNEFVMNVFIILMLLSGIGLLLS